MLLSIKTRTEMVTSVPLKNEVEYNWKKIGLLITRPCVVIRRPFIPRRVVL